MRNTTIFLLVFAVLGLGVIGLQYIPVVGFVGMFIGMPFWFGALLHVGLLAMLVLAAFGWLPRLLLIIPLAVWLAGGATWFFAGHAVEAEAQALRTQITLAQVPREIFIRGDSELATELVGTYQLDAVYSDLHRNILARAPDCTPTTKVDPNRILWLPPKLRARGECVISQRAEPPPGLIEITRIKDQERTTDNGGERAPMKVTVVEGGQPKSWTITYGTESVPMPLIYPIIGFAYGSQAGERATILDMWRYDVALVPGADDDLPIEAKARLIGQSLGLKRR